MTPVAQEEKRQRDLIIKIVDKMIADGEITLRDLEKQAGVDENERC